MSTFLEFAWYASIIPALIVLFIIAGSALLIGYILDFFRRNEK